MRKFVKAIFTLLSIMFMAGCGGGSGSTTATTTVTNLPEVVKLSDANVANKSFFSVLPNATSNTAYVTYTFSNTPTSPAANPGDWNISSTGSLVYIDSSSVQHTFTCLQQEGTYWLMSDASNNNRISRFYLDITSAQTYLNSIIAANVTPNGAILGGSVQGTTLPLTFSNVSTAAGSIAGTAGLDSGTGASGTDARFNHPLGIATDGTYLYVADTYGNTIRKIEIGTWTVTRLAGSASGLAGDNDSGTADTNGDKATFNLPTGITIVGTSLYVADYGNNTIRKVDTNTGIVTTIAGSSSEAGAVDATVGTNARFYRPFGITTDGTNLYVADCGNHLIRKIVLSSNAVFTLAGAAGSAGAADSTDGTGSTARFNLPTQIATDGSNLYVTDFNNSTIRQIVMATGEVTTLAGSAGNTGSVDGIKNAARFNRPNGITTDGVNLYVTDSSYASNNIRRIVISTRYVDTIQGVAGDTGAGYVNNSNGTAKFNGPAGITTDGIRLFVADSLNNSIRLIRGMQ
ncbi:MAG: hypothetical protein CXR30_10790 [Geobacter sp.]|nr:MAG: hypothetical protein CXR30_10790 [Geobacter sp.]